MERFSKGEMRFFIFVIFSFGDVFMGSFKLFFDNFLKFIFFGSKLLDSKKILMCLLCSV